MFAWSKLYSISQASSCWNQFQTAVVANSVSEPWLPYDQWPFEMIENNG